MASRLPRHTRNRRIRNTQCPVCQYGSPFFSCVGTGHWAEVNLGKAALLTDHNAQAWPIATWTLGHWAAVQPCSQSVLKFRHVTQIQYPQQRRRLAERKAAGLSLFLLAPMCLPLGALHILVHCEGI